MINLADLGEAAIPNDLKWGLLPFYKNALPFEGDEKIKPLWGMTLRAAGSMRFRWNETNPNRDSFLNGLCQKFGGKEILPIELIHSKIVFDANKACDTFQKQGDGIVTQNKNLIPVVTAADCVPLCFFDSKSRAFGAAHSGWKGTGIAGNVIKMMAKKYGSNPKDILAAVGPHIHDCCYTVDKSRADYFIDNFGSDTVQKLEDNKYSLSLLRANLNVMAAAGLLEENIVAAKNCTACDERFGSFRREASTLPDQDKSRLFTTQAAFVIMESRQ